MPLSAEHKHLFEGLLVGTFGNHLALVEGEIDGEPVPLVCVVFEEDSTYHIFPMAIMLADSEKDEINFNGSPATTYDGHTLNGVGPDGPIEIHAGYTRALLKRPGERVFKPAFKTPAAAKKATSKKKPPKKLPPAAKKQTSKPAGPMSPTFDLPRKFKKDQDGQGKSKKRDAKRR